MRRKPGGRRQEAAGRFRHLALCVLVAARRSLLAALSLLLFTTSCTLPGSVPETVKIGLSAPFEGLFRDLGYEALYAVRLAVRERNQSGGVAGRYQVELVALNDFNEPAEAILQAREMATDAGVLGVVGGLSVEAAEAAAPEYERLGLPFLVPVGDAAEMGQAAAAAAVELGAGSAAVLWGDSACDVALAQAFATAFAARGGSVVLQGRLDENSSVESALASADRSPDLLFIAASATRSAEAIRSARGGGFTGYIVGGPEMGSRVVVQISGQASEGVVFVSRYPSVIEEPAFTESYEALSGGAAPTPVGAWAYRATNRLLDALDSAGESGRQPTRLGVGAALPAVALGTAQVSVYVIREGRAFNPR